VNDNAPVFISATDQASVTEGAHWPYVHFFEMPCDESIIKDLNEALLGTQKIVLKLIEVNVIDLLFLFLFSFSFFNLLKTFELSYKRDFLLFSVIYVQVAFILTDKYKMIHSLQH
jgi:hypothetical protein